MESNIEIESTVLKKKRIMKKIIKIQFICAFGTVLLALGLYGMFGANGNAFLPLLDDKNVVNSLLFVGAAINIWQFYILIPLFKKLAKLPHDKGT